MADEQYVSARDAQRPPCARCGQRHETEAALAACLFEHGQDRHARCVECGQSKPAHLRDDIGTCERFKVPPPAPVTRPTTKELSGAYPNITDGFTTENYMNSIRGEADPPAPVTAQSWPKTLHDLPPHVFPEEGTRQFIGRTEALALWDALTRAREEAQRALDRRDEEIDTDILNAIDRENGLTAHLAARDAQIAHLTGALAAQDARETQAGVRCGVSRLIHGCDWPDAVAEAVLVRDAQIVTLTAEVEQETLDQVLAIVDYYQTEWGTGPRPEDVSDAAQIILERIAALRPQPSAGRVEVSRAALLDQVLAIVDYYSSPYPGRSVALATMREKLAALRPQPSAGGS